MNPYEFSLYRYQVGTRVKVIKQRAYKTENLIGEYGTIRYVYGSQIRVKLDNLYNHRSSTGSYYFTPVELMIIDEEDNFEEENTMNFAIGYLNIAKVKFVNNNGNNNCTYEYANYEPALKVGNLCVVKTAHHGLSIARVEEIVERNDVETAREIVSIVNTDTYDNRVKIRNRAAELKTEMEKRAKQLQDIALYQMLAKDDSEMMTLLNEYQSLSVM